MDTNDKKQVRLVPRLDEMLAHAPLAVRRKVEPVIDMVDMLRKVQNLKVLTSLAPSFVKGFVLRMGELPTSQMVSGHAAHFDWTYTADFPEMRTLYDRAKENQWNADTALDWSTDVDPENPEVPLVPEHFIDRHIVAAHGIKLSVPEHRRLLHDATAWMLSQFLHGEQGALYAAAQVTESVQWLDGKLYGATQVMDEARHVEVFHRYVTEKLNKFYIVNDNLFTIIDALITDPRWDMKFLGMQIMVEGLALGAFGMLYRNTEEPLLKNMLRYIIQDEARHVHYGVLALGTHISTLSERERREREDWVFEVALLMQNRFMMYEIYEEWFEHKITRRKWAEIVNLMPGMREFRSIMFSRLVPNLRCIGLLTDRMIPYYENAGLAQYMNGLSALDISGESFLDSLDANGEPPAELLHHDHDHDHEHDDHAHDPDGADYPLGGSLAHAH